MKLLFSEYLVEANMPATHTALTLYGYDYQNIDIEEMDRDDIVSNTKSKIVPLPENGPLKVSMLNQGIATFTKAVTHGRGPVNIVRSQPNVERWMEWAKSEANEMVLWKMEDGTPALTAMVYQI